MIRPCMALAWDAPLRPASPRRLATGAEAVLTRVALRLGTIRGVWPTDTLFGLPLIAWSLPPEDTVIRAEVARQVGAVPGVLRILEIAVSFVAGVLAIAVRLLVSNGESTVEAAVGDLGIWEGYTPGAWMSVLQIGHRPVMAGGLVP